MKTIADVARFVEATRTLPRSLAEFNQGRQILVASEKSRGARRLDSFFGNLLKKTNFEQVEGMNSGFAKRYAETAKTLACHDLVQHITSAGWEGLKTEASTAGVDLPTFTRQLLLTVTRAYAQLFTLQLFGVLPLTQPTGRLNFKDYQYDSSFNGSTPVINAGDRDDVIASFNPDYYAIPEGTAANLVKQHWTFLDVSSSDKRVATEWTDQMQDDAKAVYDEDVDASMTSHLVQEMTRVVDRTMVSAAINAIPGANTATFTAKPTGAGGMPNYSTLTPSEQKAWDERLWGDGIQTVISKMRVTRKYNADGDPDWMLVGTDFALGLNKLTFFLPTEKDMSEIDLQRGALRDLGVLKSAGIRVLVDPMLSISGNTNVAIFGRKPRTRGDVGIYWCPYVSLQPTRELYEPDRGMLTKAVRSRYAIAQPNTGSCAASSQLGEVYGSLTVV
jgi:hypothetical protein